MKKYIGKKWKQLTPEQQEELLSKANSGECKEGDCLIDLAENLSISGRAVATEEENYLEIDDNAIIYNPEKGIIVENDKFKGLISIKEACKIFNKEESTLRRNISNGFFKEWEDCIKFGTTWVFDIEKLEKKYGKRK